MSPKTRISAASCPSYPPAMDAAGEAFAAKLQGWGDWDWDSQGGMMVDAGWETIFGFLDTVADTYIYYILLNHLLYSIIYYIYISNTTNCR